MSVKSCQEQVEPMLCLTMCAYRKEGLDEEEYRHYMTNVHAPLVKNLMLKHGINKYTMAHNPRRTRALMDKIVDPQFASIADYDCIVQIQFQSIDQFVALKSDSLYKQVIFPDHENFADTKRTRMTIGVVQDFLINGALV